MLKNGEFVFSKKYKIAMTRSIRQTSTSERKLVLEEAGYNTNLIPSEFVYIDLLTDSGNGSFTSSTIENLVGNLTVEEISVVNQELDLVFKKFFGFKYIVPFSQGRTAEAMLSLATIRNGHIIPSNCLFMTTRGHQELRGGEVVNIAIKESLDSCIGYPFKANLDIGKLKEILNEHGKNWIPYVYVELCNNCLGGQPVSLKNLKEIKKVLRKYEIPLILDASRILENAYLIKERELGCQNKTLQQLVKETCIYADGLTMSALKDFGVDSGGFFATNSEKLFNTVLDFSLAIGTGLSASRRKALQASIVEKLSDISFVEDRVRQVRYLWSTLSKNEIPVFSPYGGHAVYVDLTNFGLIKENLAKSFLIALYQTSGIRASEHTMGSRNQMIRLAIPARRYLKEHLDDVAKAIAFLYKNKSLIKKIKKVSQPKSLLGEMRASFKLVEE